MKYLNLFEHFEPKKVAGREETAKALKIFPKPPGYIEVDLSVKVDDDSSWDDFGRCTYRWTDTDGNGEENTFAFSAAVRDSKNEEEIGSFQINLDGPFSEPWDATLNFIPEVNIVEDDYQHYKIKDLKEIEKMAEYSALHILDNILHGTLGVSTDFPEEQLKKYKDFMYDCIVPFKLKILKALTEYLD